MGKPIQVADSHAHAHMYMQHGMHFVKALQAEQLIHTLWPSGLPVTEH